MASSTTKLAKLIGRNKGFNKFFNDKVKYLSVDENGGCKATLVVGEDHINPMGTLHGGLSASLIDVVSATGLRTTEKWDRPFVSVNMNLSYMKSAIPGDEIIIDSKVLRMGKNVAYMNIEIRNNKTNNVLVKGQHTVYKLP